MNGPNSIGIDLYVRHEEQEHLACSVTVYEPSMPLCAAVEYMTDRGIKVSLIPEEGVILCDDDHDYVGMIVPCLPRGNVDEIMPVILNLIVSFPQQHEKYLEAKLMEALND